MKNILHIISLLFIIFPILICKEELLFAFQIHRHGARAPYKDVINNSDIYKETWLEKEELTNVGKRMLYLLGVKAKNRYIDKFGLLSREYSPQEILIRSTDVNRTIESVECFIQGLYPKGTGPVLKSSIASNKNITYPPNKLYTEYFEEAIKHYNLNSDNNYALPYGMNVLPIHLFYKPDHEFELYNSDLCKGHKEIYEKQKARNEIKEFANELFERFPGMYEYLEGTDDEKVLYDYWNLFKYADTYVVDNRDVRDFHFLKEKFNFTDNDLYDLGNLSKKFLMMDYSESNYPKDHPEITVMALSYTMHSIVNWMEKAKIGKDEGSKYIKYVVYSAHDSSIGALEYFMEYAFNIKGEYAELAESRFFEFYKDDNNNYKIRYMKGNSETPKLNINFDEFKKIINDVTWSDERVAEYCKFEEKKDNSDDKKDDKPSILFIIMIILSAICGVLLLILLILLLKKNKSSL
jgi:hypothetical protein